MARWCRLGLLCMSGHSGGSGLSVLLLTGYLGCAVLSRLLPLALPAAARLDVGAVDAVSPAARASHAAITLQMTAAARDAGNGDRCARLAAVLCGVLLAIGGGLTGLAVLALLVRFGGELAGRIFLSGRACRGREM